MGKLIIVPRIQQSVHFEEQQHRLAAFSLSCLQLHNNKKRIKLGFFFLNGLHIFQKQQQFLELLLILIIWVNEKCIHLKIWSDFTGSHIIFLNISLNEPFSRDLTEHAKPPVVSGTQCFVWFWAKIIAEYWMSTGTSTSYSTWKR